MPSILFVCTGNICRSPSAEALLRHHVGSEYGLIDSAGTHAYHVGEKPDERARELLSKSGISTKGVVARKVLGGDFEKFDHIIAMDQGHFKILQSICPQEYSDKIQLFSAHCLHFSGKNVPDPYYGDISDFQVMMDILADGIEGVVTRLYP